MLKGKAFKFGDNISTDLDRSGPAGATCAATCRSWPSTSWKMPTPPLPPGSKPGDFMVGGNNFGLGSSREHAPLVIKMAGVSAVLAKSVARIFFRNAINPGCRC